MLISNIHDFKFNLVLFSLKKYILIVNLNKYVKQFNNNKRIIFIKF
jgi:hypothetical protein